MKEQLIKAALLHFQAVKVKSEANLEVYLTSAAGIGEHPDVVSEVINLTKAITEADEAIKYLEAQSQKTL